MRDKKKSYWTVFEKMTSEVEKQPISTKNGRQIAKIAKIKNPKKNVRGVLGHVACCPTFGTIRSRTSEIRSVTYDDDGRRRRTTDDGRRPIAIGYRNFVPLT